MAFRSLGGRYHVCFAVTREIPDLPKTKQGVGIDLGLTDVVVISDGFKSGNPRYLEKTLRRLRKEQQKLSRKEKGSESWKRQKKCVAKVHAKVSDQRRDWLEKLTTRLVEKYDAKNVYRVGHTRINAAGDQRKSVQGFELVGSGRSEGKPFA